MPLCALDPLAPCRPRGESIFIRKHAVYLKYGQLSPAVHIPPSNYSDVAVYLTASEERNLAGAVINVIQGFHHDSSSQERGIGLVSTVVDHTPFE